MLFTFADITRTNWELRKLGSQFYWIIDQGFAHNPNKNLILTLRSHENLNNIYLLFIIDLDTYSPMRCDRINEVIDTYIGKPLEKPLLELAIWKESQMVEEE